MPQDITMCPGGECPQRRQCYRFRAVALGRQDWFGAPPYDPGTGACDSFWDIARLAPTEGRIRDRAYWLWMSAGRPDGCADAHWMQAQAELERAFAALLDDATGG
jgi:hypothetical protein